MNTANTIQVRRAIPSDYQQIVDLQLKNLRTNLSVDDQADGFLSGYFDREMLEAANQNLAVMVCMDSSSVAGFICLTRPTFGFSNDVAVAMLEKIENSKIFGKSFTDWKVCLCGPVCIDKKYRGTGTFAKLYNQIQEFCADCDLLVTLIAAENLRSIAAHQKFGLIKVNDFEWNGRAFIILAKTV